RSHSSPAVQAGQEPVNGGPRWPREWPSHWIADTYKYFQKNLSGLSISAVLVRRHCRSRGWPAETDRKPAPETSNPKPEGDATMRVLVLVKANKDSEAGVMPSEQI